MVISDLLWTVLHFQDMLSDVFETSVSPLGITSSQFGELRLDDLSDNLKAYQRLHSIPVTGKPLSDICCQYLAPVISVCVCACVRVCAGAWLLLNKNRVCCQNVTVKR